MQNFWTKKGYARLQGEWNAYVADHARIQTNHLQKNVTKKIKPRYMYPRLYHIFERSLLLLILLLQLLHLLLLILSFLHHFTHSCLETAFFFRLSFIFLNLSMNSLFIQNEILDD